MLAGMRRNSAAANVVTLAVTLSPGESRFLLALGEEARMRGSV
jgi:hypothetical protein